MWGLSDSGLECPSVSPNAPCGTAAPGIRRASVRLSRCIPAGPSPSPTAPERRSALEHTV